MSQILDAIKQADDKRKQASENKRIGNPYAFVMGKSSKKKSRLLWFVLLLTLLSTIAVLLFYTPSSNVRGTKPSIQELSQNKPTQEATEKATQAQQSAAVSQKEDKSSKATIEESAKTPSPANNKENNATTSSKVEVKNIAKNVPQLALEIPEDKSKPTGKIEQLLSDIPQQVKQMASKDLQTKKTTKDTEKAGNISSAKPPATNVDVNSSVAAWKEDMTISAIFNHAEQSKRFVLIAGKKLKEGDTIPYRDLQLLKIMDNGIIVSGSDGQTFIKTY